MKKIINGRRYDTDSAKEVGYTSYSNQSDFNYWKETLYRKNTGEFFLHGEGGPASRYAQPDGLNCWSGGERIMPLSIEEAREWAEKYLDADEYEKIFEVAEDGEKKTVTFSLPESVIELIKRSAARDQISMSEYVAELVKSKES